jgi:hypothetical protein
VLSLSTTLLKSEGGQGIREEKNEKAAAGMGNTCPPSLLSKGLIFGKI